MCRLDFFGIDEMVFAYEALFDRDGETMYIRDTIKVIDSLDICGEDRKKIYHGNAGKLKKPNGN